MAIQHLNDREKYWSELIKYKKSLKKSIHS